MSGLANRMASFICDGRKLFIFLRLFDCSYAVFVCNEYVSDLFVHW